MQVDPGCSCGNAGLNAEGAEAYFNGRCRGQTSHFDSLHITLDSLDLIHQVSNVGGVQVLRASKVILGLHDARGTTKA
jgi:hypothetical protein